MVRVLLGSSLVTLTSLTACGSSQIEIPASVDAKAQNCYRLIAKENPDHPIDIEGPIALEDGTLLVQWQVSAENYGSCQIDSTGSILLVTQAEPPTEASAPADSEASTAPSANQ